MRNEFTAILEKDGDWHIAYCPEIPGANGQGHTKEEAKKSLAEAIQLMLKDRREEGMRGVLHSAATTEGVTACGETRSLKKCGDFARIMLPSSITI